MTRHCALCVHVHVHDVVGADGSVVRHDRTTHSGHSDAVGEEVAALDAEVRRDGTVVRRWVGKRRAEVGVAAHGRDVWCGGEAGEHAWFLGLRRRRHFDAVGTGSRRRVSGQSRAVVRDIAVGQKGHVGRDADEVADCERDGRLVQGAKGSECDRQIDVGEIRRVASNRGVAQRAASIHTHNIDASRSRCLRQCGAGRGCRIALHRAPLTGRKTHGPLRLQLTGAPHTVARALGDAGAIELHAHSRLYKEIGVAEPELDDVHLVRLCEDHGAVRVVVRGSDERHAGGTRDPGRCDEVDTWR
eukprot:PhM_4_TR18074/c1_g1_i1/m.44540